MPRLSGRSISRARGDLAPDGQSPELGAAIERGVPVILTRCVRGLAAEPRRLRHAGAFGNSNKPAMPLVLGKGDRPVGETSRRWRTL